MAITGEITYNADGTVRITYPDGSSTLMSGPGENATILEKKTAAGDVYSNFDSNGNPHNVRFADGSTGVFTYNADGTVRLDRSDGSSILLSGPGDDAVILTSTSPDGSVSTYEYRPGGQYVVTTGDQHTLYTKDGDPVKTWKGGDESTASTYGPGPNGGYTLTEPDGTVTTYSKDGNPVTSKEPDGTLTEFGPDGNPIKTTHPDGSVSTYEYRPGGQYVVTTGDQHTLYTKDGDPVKTWKGGDESTASTYGPGPNGGYTLTEPDGTVTTYSKDGNPVTSKESDGTLTEFGPDGNPIKTTHPDGSVSTYEYRPGGQYVVTTGDQHTLYTKDGDPVKTWKGGDESTASTYGPGPNGGFTLTEPDGTVTTYSKDGNPVTSKESDGTLTEFGPDGNPIKTTHPDGSVSTYEYRPGGQYVVTTGDQHTLYTKDGDPVKTWKGGDESTASTYGPGPNGGFTLTEPDGTVTTYSKDGNPVTSKESDGTLTEFGPDGNPIKTTHPDGSVSTYEYRPDGQYVVTTGDQHTLYTKDGDPVKTWKGGDESTASTYGPGPNGGFTLTEPDGTVTTFTKDGKPVTSKESDGTLTEFGPDGNPIKTTHPDGSVSTYEFRPDGQYVVTTGDQHTLYTKDGDPIKTWKGGDESTASVWGPGPNGGYTLTEPDGTVTTYTKDFRPVSRKEPDGTLTEFDDKGRPAKITHPDGTVTTFEYTQDGGVTITNSDGTSTHYDGGGRRTSTKTADGRIIEWSIEMPKLWDAAKKVGMKSHLLKTEIAVMASALESVSSNWKSPAGEEFQPLRTAFNRFSLDLIGLLEESAKRMEIAYKNYKEGETINIANLKPR